MISLISDLDSTLIYPRQPNYHIVEYFEGRPISWMTKRASDMLDNLLRSPNFQLIPCTLRSFEQTMRIEFLKNNPPKYMICDNGASIYVDGILDKHYQDYLNANNILKCEMVSEMKKVLEENTHTFVKDNRMTFLVVMYPSHEMAITQVGYVQGLMKDYPVLVERQGRKVYVLPYGLGKEVAVKYMIDVMGIQPTFTSGDGFVDEKFVRLGINQVVPGHAVYEHHLKMKTSGIIAGEKILDTVARGYLHENTPLNGEKVFIMKG